MAATPTGGAARRRSGRRCRARRRCRLTSRSRACRCAPPAARSPTTSRRSSGPSRAPRSSSRWGCPARAPRPRCSSPTCRTSTCGSMPSTRPEAYSMRDEGTVEVAKMVLVGKVHKDIVLRLGRHGQAAVGLSGDDGALFRVVRRPAPGGEDIGFVGRIERVNVGVIEHIASDYIPVIASVGADREGRSYNVNADEAAGAVAAAMGAYKLLFLTDVPGWLRDPGDPGSLIAHATDEQVRDALPSLAGGMRPKLEACLE